MQLKDLTQLLRGRLKSNDNLHYIAIDNIKDDSLLLRKWWHKKYKIPPKPLDEYTYEELLIEQLEDYYLGDSSRIEAFLNSVGKGEDSWDGEIAPEIEMVLENRKRKSKGKIKKYQTDEDISEEDFNKMMDNVGYELPNSKRLVEQGSGLDDEEFEETFL